ncbi:MAG: glycoside hydrolase TIM-barrel-like domain-containing protein, partial [Methylovirgula sp.]
APDPSAWPPAAAEMNGLGLTGQPTLTSIAYLKANIEGGEKFNWYYNDGANDGLGLDPYGTDLRVSLPEGDRLAQNRQPYYPSQQLLANKQLRWWWNNPHQAIYDDGDGTGWSPHGPATEWAPQSKSIIFAEYGIPSCDKGTNQPNVFFSPASVESFTPYWSIWDPVSGGGFLPRIDDEIQLLALQAIYEYWVNDGNNATSASGVKMIEPTFLSAWNWDARPFPIFPQLSSVWGDTGDWAAGQWLSGKGPFLTPLVPDAVPIAPAPASFPTLSGQGWSVHYRPAFATGLASHVSGRESRAAKMSLPLWEIELSFDLLRMDMSADLQTLIGFYDTMAGQEGTFTFPIPAELGIGSSLTCRFDDDSEDLEEFMSRLFSLQSLKLRSVK